MKTPRIGRLPAQRNRGYDERMRSTQWFTSDGFRKKLAAIAVSFSLLAGCVSQASASNSEDVEHYDARVQGYEPDVELKSSSVGITWIVTVFLGVVVLGVLFKDGKRSHLD